LLDHERDFRRAHHLHDRDVFVRRFNVVVHEHCERPIGNVQCAHYEGSPIRDAFAGVVALLDAWTADPPECADLRCLPEGPVSEITDPRTSPWHWSSETPQRQRGVS
jgi:hypothetical protein